MTNLAEVKTFALVAPRALTRDELRLDLIPAVWAEAKNDLSLFDDLGESELSITDLAAAAIGVAMAKQFGHVFEIPRDQYSLLVWNYVEHLAGEKLILATRALR